MSDPLTPNQVAARLDRLPPSPFHRRFLALIALGTWFDYYDNFVAGALAVILVEAHVLPKTASGDWFSQVGLFMAAMPLGMFVGTVFFGLASDYLGRRFGFITMLLLYSLASLAGGAGYYPLAAAAGSTAGLVLLLATRLLAGAGIGAENVIIDAYVTEVVPRQVRGRSVALVHAIAFTAVPVAALLARLLAGEQTPENWWLLLVIGSLGALLSWYFRRRLPESPRWSAAAGRSEEAAKTLLEIEKAVAESSGQPLPPAESLPRQPTARTMPFRAIWSPQYRGRTIMLVVFHLLQTVGYYGFMHWLATLLRAKGFRPDDALAMQFGAFLLAPVGPLIGVWSSERWQRKWLLVVLALALSLGYFCFGLAGNALVLTLLGAGVVVGSNWFSAIFHAYQAELFPTAARATGVGFTYAWSRATMVFLSLVMPGLIATDLWGAFGLMIAAMLAVAGTVTWFGPLTNNQPLEEPHAGELMAKTDPPIDH
jgi:putative MFS transporter